MINITQYLAGETVVGEGPCWDAQRARLTWVDIDRRQVFVHERGCTRVFGTPDRVGVAVPTADGSLLIAYGMQVGLLSTVDGTIVPLCEPVEDPRRVRLNDGGTDPFGCFWAGSAPIDEKDSDAAALYRLGKDGRLVQVLGGLGLANGITWTADGRFMYIADTLARRIHRMERDLKSGKVGDPVVLVDTLELQGAPDGIAVDRDGDLWVAFWDGDAIHRFSSDGVLRTSIPLPVSRPTSCVFAGPKLDRLLITTARWGLSASQLAAQPLAGSILATTPGTRGFAQTPATVLP